MTVADIPKLKQGSSVVLEPISWDLYERLVEELGESHIFLTYDEGRLEIMAPLPIHDRVKKAVSRVIEMYSLEVDIPVEGFGSTTFKRRDLRKGLEPDECYYVANIAAVEGRTEFDFTIDPPPDLAIEVDWRSRSIDRQSIYAALGVPEIWRYDGTKFTYLKRSKQGKYVHTEKSLAFPNLPVSDLNRFVEMAMAGRQHETMKALQKWVRSQR